MGKNSEKIEINLPQDIIFVMRGMERPEEVKRKMKMALAIILFQESAISLGKAAELAEISRVRFMEALKEHGLYSYEYGEKDFERDEVVIKGSGETGSEETASATKVGWIKNKTVLQNSQDFYEVWFRLVGDKGCSHH